ncbi:MAG TPA: hypothetical protein VF545_07625 [Thermoleophilaceae bacterium]|jgi:hypothetical protein
MKLSGVAVGLIAFALNATPGSADNTSLPSVGSGHRPGPDALYQPPADAPQLQNAAPWKAPPILVSGASAYRDGEFLYQDFLYDDHGAAGIPDDNNPIGPDAFLYSPVAGTFTYPTDPVYANNAADLVELRVRPLAAATAFRVTLNSLKDPGRTAFTIALGDTGVARQWPHGAGISSPAALFLTVHGSSAELLDATTGAKMTPAPTATVDLERRQIDVRVPHAAWDPVKGKVRLTIGTGLWSPAGGAYLAPAADSATADTPGGGGAPSQAAIVNVGPRYDEPYHDPAQPPSITLADSAAVAAVAARMWRERAQADALRVGDVSHFSTDVDFSKLAAGRDDDSGVPKAGPMDRILASHHQFGQGLDPSKVCYDLAADFRAGAKCVGRQVGQLQPYALYVPRKPQPRNGWGMTLLPHSLSANYNQYSDSRNQSELGERGAGSLVLTPGGRGPDGFSAGIAEADLFEAWADVARHYRIDPEWTAITGYSMGAFSTYRMLVRWPDLFARGMSTVGVPGSADDQLGSLRNTPVMAWNAAGDELVNLSESEEADRNLAAAGLRFVAWLFPAADHLTIATNDEYGPAADFLGAHRVDRDPPHVTYVVDPVEDSAVAKAQADHAYWVSGAAVRDLKAAPTGTIDVRSQGFGTGDPPVLGVKPGGGSLNGGNHGPMPYVERSQDWGSAPRTPVRDALEITARNVSTVTIDARRARVSCAAKLNVKSDGPLKVVLGGCTAGLPSNSRCVDRRKFRFKLHHYRRARVVRVKVFVNGRLKLDRRGRNLRRVTIKRLPRKTFRVKIVSTQSTGAQVVSTRKYRGCRKSRAKTRVRRHGRGGRR